VDNVREKFGNLGEIFRVRELHVEISLDNPEVAHRDSSRSRLAQAAPNTTDAMGVLLRYPDFPRTYSYDSSFLEFTHERRVVDRQPSPGLFETTLP